ncbi:3-deoxy-7-phosphoheptulonate synthase [Synechococcus elongatus]|uniref:Phospho-2-dehydro-3-deoxyheptonate aldolase n=2 Tax=Synechococcus elongatus TaxID=32046 RepID=A0AAN1UVG8_SYNEL|nr:3-deoxy-7-phosphoheptulonate synthase [Synechococcus elongatus]AZB73616.1 3-deoxy-7-phosphoheptulonate synthase [Synechococcus elongatus PCC 11801]QFZ91593.1 3-deoxy-7-phosphoheptulonate synthase [Synechococcus elongatus PCC 11802]
MKQTSDLHVVETRSLISPAEIHQKLPISEAAADLVASTRDRIRSILRNGDRRLLVIVGPCSIHDVDAAYDYGKKLLPLREELADELEIVMRVYFEKPRTTVGWKGLINDPHLDGSYDINTGIQRARKLLLGLADMGLPAATELLDPIIPQYIADVIAWTAIGARTTESQTHREMASGLSMPIGFKNGTDGSFHIAANAMLSASQPHHFLGINHEGLASIVSTTGNPDGHLVLRGGSKGPNYAAADIEQAAYQLASMGLHSRVMVDCSHGNSNKDYRRQSVVLADLAEQVAEGSRHLMGVMIESHLVEGNQPIPADLSQLRYGQSITDPCVDFPTTEKMLRDLARAQRGLVPSLA